MCGHVDLVGKVLLPLQLVHGGDDVGHLLQVDTTAVVHIVHPGHTHMAARTRANLYTTAKLSKKDYPCVDLNFTDCTTTTVKFIHTVCSEPAKQANKLQWAAFLYSLMSLQINRHM